MMKILSPAFKYGDSFPSKYTCDGKNVNPELIFLDVPQNTKSLCLLCHDPDAPKKYGWMHWAILNMPPSMKGIQENATNIPGTQIVTDFGKIGYGGPCPPSGTHRYFFYLYALDQIIMFSQPSRITKEDLEDMMQKHLIEKAELMGTYEKNKKLI